MSSSLLSLVVNLSEGLHNDKCTDCKSYLECISTKNELLTFNCSKNHEKHFSKSLIKRLTYKYI